MTRNETTTETVTMEMVLKEENLRAAWVAVRANDGAPGVDGRDIEQTRDHIRRHWPALAAKLQAGRYRPGAVRAVSIPKASGGTRTLGIPNVLDRVIQQALHQQLSPVWEPQFSDHSYGFRPNRSAHDAVRAGQRYLSEGKHWVVDLDLKSFFDQVDHDILMQRVARQVRDKRVLGLIGDYLRAPMQVGADRQPKRQRGTPQGGPLSPLLANIYLDPLDKELEQRGLSFVRYADDIAIFVSSPRAAERVLASITAWIEKHLKVEVNRDKSGSGPSDQSSLLGFRLYADQRLGVAPKAVERLKQNVRTLWEARQNLTSRELAAQWQRYIRGWWNYFQLADWRREVDYLSGWIRRHIRKCFWLRWKTPLGRLHALRRLGVQGRAVAIGYCRRGAWAMARHVTVQKALNNKTLARHGFIVPWSFAVAQQ
jgi:RNA-directed DNA polymerase